MIQRPHGLLVELEYHVKELKEKLGEKEHTEQLKFESSNLLYRVSIATLVLARVGGSPLNYSQIKHRALTLVPAILGLLDELLSLVKGLCVVWKVSLGRKVPGDPYCFCSRCSKVLGSSCGNVFLGF